MNSLPRYAATDPQLYRQAAEVLKERGHCREVLEDQHGRVCLAGALNVANMNIWPSSLNEALEQIRLTLGLPDKYRHEEWKLGHSWIRNDSAVTWNNEPGRTQDEVIDALIRTAWRLEDAQVRAALEDDQPDAI